MKYRDGDWVQFCPTDLENLCLSKTADGSIGVVTEVDHNGWVPHGWGPGCAGMVGNV